MVAMHPVYTIRGGPLPGCTPPRAPPDPRRECGRRVQHCGHSTQVHERTNVGQGRFIMETNDKGKACRMRKKGHMADFYTALKNDVVERGELDWVSIAELFDIARSLGARNSRD